MSTFNETPFTGVAVKVKMVCYPGGMCPLDGGDVIQQKLSINANGRANYTTMEHYFPVDLIRSGGRWEKRNIGPEQATDLLSAIAESFRTLDEFCIACDAGMWDIEIENADGEIFKYSGFSIPGCFAKAEEISNRIRTELWLDDFYAFDGGYYEEEKEYIYCRVAVDISSGLRSYWYIADTDDFEVGSKVIVPFGRENNEIIGEIIDIETCSEDDVPFPVEKTKHILRVYDDEEFDPPVIMGSEPLQDGAEWRWCLVGNIVETHPFGEEHETRVGTKHFPPGAKVFIAPAQWGDGMEKVVVIGKPRGRRPYVEVVMPSKHIENFRLQKVYRPAVLKCMAGSEYSWWGNNNSDCDTIQAFINSVNR